MPSRPVAPAAFLGVAVASLGGPLALAALSAPALVGDASASAGLAAVAAAVVFLAPLAIWLRYSRQVSGGGGLAAFVQAAAGRRVAVVQATIWTFSYLLYVVYTTVQIVYDVLPAALPGERGWQTPLALAVPVAVVAVMLAGRTVALVVVGLIAGGQLALLGVLDGITLAHLPTGAGTFAAGAPTGPLVRTGAQTSLLYVCGSLPLFMGGELARPAQTIRRGLSAAYVVTAAAVVLAVAPLAAAPGLARTDLPGVRVAQEFAGGAIAEAIGIGVAVSIAGVILCEYLALTRLWHAFTGWRVRPLSAGIGVLLLAAAPVSLIDPEGFYSMLAAPSLVALWLSQLIVFAAYPRFAVRSGQRPLSAWGLSAVASSLALYGLWLALTQTGS